MKIGLALPHYDVSFPDGRPVSMSRVLSYAERAEALGFDSVWVSDHLFLEVDRYGGPPGRQATPDAVVMLAAIAARTERVRVGSLVLCTPFRNPRILVHEARAVDDLSRGRLELGVGAGWYQAEFEEAGIPFGSVGDRMAALEATTRALQEAFGGRPPLWVGGKGGPRIMGIVAGAADGWNIVWRVTPDEYRAKLDVLADACRAHGRDPASVRRSVGLYTLLGSDAADLRARYEALQRWAPGGLLDGVPLERFAEGGLVGTIEQCAERLREFEALGVEEVVCSFAPLPFALADDAQLELAARDLAPLVR